MNKEQNNKLVPMLRFKQSNGQAYPEWREVSLSTLANLATIKNKDSEVNRVLTNSAANGIVDQRDYFEKDIANSSNLEGYYIVELGDYVYNPRVSNIAPVGPVSKNKIGKGVMSPLYTVFRFNNDENDFFEQYFKTSHWHKYLRLVSNTGARFDRMSITPSVFMDMPIPCPKPEEQQKIASCLSSLDDLITAHTKKLEALKAHKKGIMQQLFPAEGEPVPKLRFAEFKDSGDWEEKTFDQLFDIGSGRDYKHLEKGDIPVYGSGGYMLSVNDYLYDGESVCIGRKGTIDNPIFLTGKFWTVDTLFYTYSFKDCLPKFIFFIFQNINWYNYNEAGGVPSLSKTTIGKIKILVPKPTEQQKISDCLSALDELINVEVQEIEQLKHHKKGLMQGLFPNINEENL